MLRAGANLSSRFQRSLGRPVAIPVSSLTVCKPYFDTLGHMLDMLERFFLYPSDWRTAGARLVLAKLHKTSVAPSFEETNSRTIPVCAEPADDRPKMDATTIKIAMYARCEQLGAKLDEIERWLPELADEQMRYKIIDEVLKLRAELVLIAGELAHGLPPILRSASLSQRSVACSFEEAA